MEKMIRRAFLLSCLVLFFLATATEGVARMDRKPTMQGAFGNSTGASFTCEDGVCECHGVKDCVSMTRSGVCKGGINCTDDSCMCQQKGSSYGNRPSPGNFRNFQQ